MKTTQTPAAAENEKWLRIRVRFFHKFLTPAPSPKEKRRILQEMTPALRIRGHLQCRPSGTLKNWVISSFQ